MCPVRLVTYVSGRSLFQTRPDTSQRVRHERMMQQYADMLEGCGITGLGKRG